MKINKIKNCYECEHSEYKENYDENFIIINQYWFCNLWNKKIEKDIYKEQIEDFCKLPDYIKIWYDPKELSQNNKKIFYIYKDITGIITGQIILYDEDFNKWLFQRKGEIIKWTYFDVVLKITGGIVE